MEKFKVHVKFDHGGGGIIEDHTRDTLMSALQRLVLGPASMIGMIQEVKCVDSGDCTNFLARKVDGKVKVVIPLDTHRHRIALDPTWFARRKMTRFITHNSCYLDTNMTHLQGYISASFKGLCKVFGKPMEGDGYKTDWEWAVEFSDGTIATIYNWKNGPSYTGEDISPDSISEWHIGGLSKEAHHLTETAYHNEFDSMFVVCS